MSKDLTEILHHIENDLFSLEEQIGDCRHPMEIKPLRYLADERRRWVNALRKAMERK